MPDEFQWVYSLVKNALEGTRGVKVVSGYTIDFDRWYWGKTPAIVKRAELVVEREMRESSVLGLFTRKRALVSLEELAEICADDPLPPLSYVTGGVVVFQRPLGYMGHSCRYFGSGMFPLVEHVEVRESPFLQKEFLGRVKAHDPVGGKHLFREPHVYAPDVVFEEGYVVPLEQVPIRTVFFV